jgi:chemotaxis signal transduction protein
MARDSSLEKEFSQLEREIEAKVDSLFVEIEEGEGAASSAGEDPWKELKEHFLTLEWEIDAEVLGKIATEVKSLQARFPDGAVGTLLGWLAQVTDRVRGQGGEVEQDSMKILHQLKEGLLRVAEDPFQDSDAILNSLRGKVERMLMGEEEEAPTITLDAVKGGVDGLLMEELDRTVEEALRPEEDDLLFSEEPEEEISFAEDETTVMQPVKRETPRMAAEPEAPMVETDEQISWEAPPPVEEARPLVPSGIVPLAPVGTPAVPTLEEEGMGDLERIKRDLSSSGSQLKDMLVALRKTDDPLGLATVLGEVTERFREFSRRLEGLSGILDDQLRELATLELIPKQPEPLVEAPAEPEEAREEVLFMSVSNRVFGIPMASVRGVYRVPGKAVPQLVQMTEIQIQGRNVPLISLWKKLGLGRALYTFPKEEKRVLLVKSGTGEVGLLVDQVLARQEVSLRPVEGGERGLFRGIVTVEKNAYVVDIEAL